MEEIKIVEYNHSLAGQVADMWNKSFDSWGGSSVIRTEEVVIRQHDNATHLNIFLAVKDDEVLGYCSFDKFVMDEGALYVNTLNVRPDYHGKKIGKMLVLRCVERTIELNWPRVDLFTWPGNTKAVPLYKKCGFFWEKRDDTTHLMNFIPTVLNTEAIKDYFEKADWYKDSTRAIEVIPDGRNENGFDYYEYSWEKDGSKLRVEFERTGRGIRLIETDDYIISAGICDSAPVFGRRYGVDYRVVNKSGKPLSVLIKGINNKNIEFSMEAHKEVEKEEIIKGEFFVGEVAEEPSKWITHPAVAAEIEINGKKALFKVGVIPKFPAKMAMIVPEDECFTGAQAHCFINIENNFKESAVFEFSIPEPENITFEHRSFELSLPAKGRSSIKLPYELKDYGFYSTGIHVAARLDNGETINFGRKLEAPFRGQTGMFGGETEDGWMACNGSYYVFLNKFSNDLKVRQYNKDFSHETFWKFPKVGKPYSSEFFRNKPERVEYFTEKDAVILKAFYFSEDFTGIEVASVTRLYASGIVEHYYEVKNRSASENAEDIWFIDSAVHNLFRGILPYEDRFLEIKNAFRDGFEYLDSSKLSENWMFSQSSDIPRGFCWNPDMKVNFDNWSIYFEYNLGRLTVGEVRRTESTWLALGTYSKWEDFRNFALKRKESDKITLTDCLELSVNNGNPFVGDCFTAGAREHRSTCFDGEISVSSLGGMFPAVSNSFSLPQGITQAEFPVQAQGIKGIDTVRFDINFGVLELQRESVIFKKSPGSIETQVLLEQGQDIYTVGNGVIGLKAAPFFSNGLISLSYNGSEWLDTSFPTQIPKLWWNPWLGGITASLSGLNTKSVMEEKPAASFVSMEDSKGNLWEGTKVSLDISKNEHYKGLRCNQYFLLLPGVPVMCYTAEIHQNTGFFLNDVDYEMECFLKPGDDFRKCWFASRDRTGEMLKLKAGSEQHCIRADSGVLFGSSERQDMLLVYTDFSDYEVLPFTYKEALNFYCSGKLNVENGKKLFTRPVFFIFTGERIPDKLLKDLNNIEFNKGR